MFQNGQYNPHIYVSSQRKCPYLPDRVERRLFLRTSANLPKEFHSALARKGFRRWENTLYLPYCPNCNACLPVRVKVDSFNPSKSQNRILKKNAGILRRRHEAKADQESYCLFSRYVNSRHRIGGMAGMDISEFGSMVENSDSDSCLVKYYDIDLDNNERRLVAATLTDILTDGLSMLYSFFDTEHANRSLGTYMILDHVSLAKQLDLQYVYLGYWIPQSKKMQYKSRFGSMQIFREGKWRKLESIEKYSPTSFPPLTESDE